MARLDEKFRHVLLISTSMVNKKNRNLSQLLYFTRYKHVDTMFIGSYMILSF